MPLRFRLGGQTFRLVYWTYYLVKVGMGYYSLRFGLGSLEFSLAYRAILCSSIIIYSRHCQTLQHQHCTKLDML